MAVRMKEYSDLKDAAQALSRAARAFAAATDNDPAARAIEAVCAGLASILLVPMFWEEAMPRVLEAVKDGAEDRLTRLVEAARLEAN